jgi:hydrogenase maturation protease
MDRSTRVEVEKVETMREDKSSGCDGAVADGRKVRVLIVGFGNPLRSDDGAGWQIAQRISRDLMQSGVKVVACQQLTPELADFASHAERVLFVDAAHGGVPGEVECRRVVPAASAGEHSHELTPAAVLNLAKMLYGHCPPAWLFTIAGESFATGDSLSAAVSAVMPTLLKRIERFVNSDEATDESGEVDLKKATNKQPTKLE